MSIEWDVNYIAVVVAAVAGMVIGAVYFMPAVAGNAWMKAIGKTPEDFNRRQPTRFVRAGGCIHPADGDFVGCCDWLGGCRHVD